jgi:hypothetical protein
VFRGERFLPAPTRNGYIEASLQYKECPVKRFASSLALCALTLASGAHAAVQVVSTTAYQLSYDDTVLSYLGNGTLSFKAAEGVSTSGFFNLIGSASQAPYLTLTANDDYLITAVSQTVTGSLTGQAISLLMASTGWADVASGYAAPLQSSEVNLPSGDFVLSSALDLTGVGGQSLSLMGYRLMAGLLGQSGTEVNTLGIRSFTLNIQAAGGVSAVPEPQGLALLMAGVGVVWLRRRIERH